MPGRREKGGHCLPCPHFIRDYCREFFVSKGMIADFAIRQEKKKAKHRGR